MKRPTCESCMYGLYFDSSLQCRRYAPFPYRPTDILAVHIKEFGDDDTEPFWPIMNDEWNLCGEHQDFRTWWEYEQKENKS